MTHAAAPPWRRADWRYLAALVALATALWLPRLRGPLDLRYDAGVYYILGTSLAEGRGYRLLSEPGVPNGFDMEIIVGNYEPIYTTQA